MDVTGPREFAATTGGVPRSGRIVPGGRIGRECILALRSHLTGALVSGWRVWQLDLFDFEGFEDWVVRLSFADRGFRRGLAAQKAHGDIDVLEDSSRGDAEHAVRGFDEVVALVSAMLATEVVDEAEN